MSRKTPLAIVLAALVAATMACEETPADPDENEEVGEETGQLQILLRDQPVNYLAEAWIQIPRVFVIVEGEDESSFIDLFNDPDNPHEFDLLTLQDEVVADLTGEPEVPAVTFSELRVVVSEARVILRDPYEFNDGGTERALSVPSAARSGVKVFLSEPIVVEPGVVTVVVIDVDVNENFVVQGNPQTPAGISGVTFTPVVREVDRELNQG